MFKFSRSALVLAAIIFCAYLPSLGHVFRADQLIYMADMGQRPQNFQTLVLKSYDYSRDRVFFKGDQDLFRPLLFIFLGLEYYAFGTDPLGGQLTGIILHILLTVTIFRFLWLVFDRSLAFISALYFGVLPTIMEMVVFQNIHYYMLSLIFFYLACIGILDFKKRYDIKYVFLISAALTGAVLTYEAACAVTLIIAGYVFWITPQNIPRRFLNSGIVLTPVVIYLSWDFWSLNIHHLNMWTTAVPATFSLVETLKNFFFVHLECLERIALPAQFGIIIKTNDRFTGSTFNGFNPATVFWIVLLYYYVRAISINAIRKGFELRNVFIVSVILFCFMLTIGRINPYGLGKLEQEVHYSYLYISFCLPLIAGFVDIRKLKGLIVHSWQKKLLLFAIIGSIGYCFIYTLSKNIEGSIKFTPQRELLTFVNQFIHQHKNEPDFSLTVAYDAKGNYFMEGFKTKENTDYTFAQAVYARYYKIDHWRYRIFYDPAENMYRVQRKNWLL